MKTTKPKQVTVRVLIGVDKRGMAYAIEQYDCERRATLKDNAFMEEIVHENGDTPVWIEATFDVPKPTHAPVVKGKKL